MYYLGYDVGSSSIKVALVEASTGKKIIALQEPTEEMSIVALRDGWAEQDPEIWWRHIVKRTAQVGSAYKAYSINANKDGGWCCSSDEAPVMGVERRTPLMWLLV